MAISVRIKHKIDTAANWTTRNPVLMAGEMIFVIDTDGQKIKIGDGTSTYTQLPFLQIGGSSSSDSITSETVEAMIKANWGFCENESDMNTFVTVTAGGDSN